MARFLAVLTAATLAAVVAVISPSAAGLGGSRSYADPAGDATGGAPDIETVVVSDDDNGMITVAVSTPNRPTLNGDDVVAAVVATGGRDGIAVLYAGSGVTVVCALPLEDVCTPSTVPVGTAFANGTTTFTIDGNAAGVDGDIGVVAMTTEMVDDADSRQDIGPLIDYQLDATTESPDAPADTVAPYAKAAPVSATHGRSVKLSYHAWDDSGKTREDLAVYQGQRQLWRTSTMLGPSSQAQLRSLTWKVPRTVHGKLRFSVQAWDESGNASPVSWATVTVR